MDIKLESSKLRLIQVIMSINDAVMLFELEKKAKEITQKQAVKTPDIAKAIMPIQSNISLAEIDKKQGYQPISYEEFRKNADQLNLQESIEELLQQLTK